MTSPSDFTVLLNRIPFILFSFSLILVTTVVSPFFRRLVHVGRLSDNVLIGRIFIPSIIILNYSERRLKNQALACCNH